MIARIALSLFGALVVAAGAFAQSALADPGEDEATTAVAPPPPSTLDALADAGSGPDAAWVADAVSGGGAFSELSPGNRKIARALFEAQTAATGQDAGPGAEPWTLAEIASAKQAGIGWGQLFKVMQAQGLIEAKNLGQVVSEFNHRHRLAESGPAEAAPILPKPKPRLAEGPEQERGAETDRPWSSGPGAAPEPGSELAVATDTPGTPPGVEGSFRRLSPGNQKIARALLEAQIQPLDPEAEPAWSLDEIAAAKLAGQGWGQVFKELQAKRLIGARNLGEVVSAYERQAPFVAVGSPTIISNASGQQVVVGVRRKPGRALGLSRKARGGKDKGDKHVKPSAHGGPADGYLTTAAGPADAPAAAPQGHGNGVGLTTAGGKGGHGLGKGLGLATASGPATAVAGGAVAGTVATGHGGGLGNAFGKTKVK